jgi:hypothetical protein
MYGSRPTTRLLSMMESVARLLAGLDSPFIVRRPATPEGTGAARRRDHRASQTHGRTSVIVENVE